MNECENCKVLQERLGELQDKYDTLYKVVDVSCADIKTLIDEDIKSLIDDMVSEL